MNTDLNSGIMLDLETLGTRPGSVIVAIGAAYFGGGTIKGTFYETIDPQSCQDTGFSFDASSICWWLRQSEEARKTTFPEKGANHIFDALTNFADWYRACGDTLKIWGNGATFDNVLLSEAYRIVGMRQPWSHRNSVCYRTIKDAFPGVPFERVGTHHNALDDAISQAHHLMRILSEGGR